MILSVITLVRETTRENRNNENQDNKNRNVKLPGWMRNVIIKLLVQFNLCTSVATLTILCLTCVIVQEKRKKTKTLPITKHGYSVRHMRFRNDRVTSTIIILREIGRTRDIPRMYFRRLETGASITMSSARIFIIFAIDDNAP